MQISSLCLLLASLLTVWCANVTGTPPEYDPKSEVCPGNCLGTYVNPLFAANKCAGLVGVCVCDGMLDSPPLGDLKSCLQGPTCSMSAADTETYVSGLLAFEGCTVTSTSVHTESGTTVTEGGRVTTGPVTTGAGGQPPSSTTSKNRGAIAYSAPLGGGGLVAFGAAVAGALLGTRLV